MDEFRPVFENQQSGCPKENDCIRLDGACDEERSHELVQFYWTEWHNQHQKVATLVTTRSSGSSYLNRVELQNGCLSLGHSNTFIPSTMGGNCMDPETGKIDEGNLALAISAYLSGVDGCPCGETQIKLFKVSNSEQYQTMNSHLLVYLKGSKKSKETLKVEHPNLYQHFEDVWSVRNRHMVTGLPQAAYIFFLRCCYQLECIHQKCQQNPDSSTWYPGRPSIPIPHSIAST